MVQPLFLLHLRRESEISNFSSQISVFISEKVSDPRPRVTRPAPAGRVTCARGSRDLRARVADYVLMRNEKMGEKNRLLGRCFAISAFIPAG